MKLSPGRKRRFQDKLLDWYAEHQRDLPWRRTRDPYAVLVSELMLQQTQVDRVLPKYAAWMKQFPTAKQLAAAPAREVIAAWQGLGYNRRALYLHEIAKTVTNEMGGVFPNTREGLLELKGIGPYTAGAIMSFAYEADETILDTNVKRVIGRVFLGFQKLPSTKDTVLWEMLANLLPKKGRTYNFNQALMDFGATTCQLRKPKCGECPFQRMCASYPAIQTAAPAKLRYQKKANEKQYFGQPRRIWRGKILKYLHENDGATYTQVGKAIQSDFDRSRLPWLKDTCSLLEKDGMARITGQRVYLP